MEHATHIASGTKSFISNTVSSYGKAVYNNTIFCLLDQSFDNPMKDYSTSRRLLEGAKSAAAVFIPSTIASIVANSLNQAAKIPHYEYSVTVFDAVILAPVMEELIFRVILQNAIQASQAGLKAIAPQRLQEMYIFQAITSQKGRIVAITTLFAVIHLANAPFIAANTLALTTVIILFPVCTLAYERGGFEASWAAHMTNNLICCYF